jgi:uracil-DNA glycosylase
MDRRRIALLDAMGIDRYVRRGGPGERPVEPEASPPEVQRPAAPPPVPRPPVGAVVRPLRPAPVLAEAPSVRAPQSVLASPPDTTGLSWAQLLAGVQECRRCALCESRTQTVFGVGDPAARWMIVGEAPGADEDRQGEPFVGRAGQLLNAMLQAIGQPRATVYIANVLKCRPPGNRDPLPDEVRQCLPNLQRQIELVDPALIVCVGRVAAQNLLGVDLPLAQLRGRVHRLGATGRPVIVTYHPAYLLRTPSEKRKAWADLKFALEVAHGRGA